MNILFTCAGRRNYLINYFKDSLQGQGKVFATDKQLNAPALVDADVAIQVPNIYDKNYIPTIIDIVKKHNIKAIISLNDLELPILSTKKSEIEKYGTKVIVSNEDIIDISFDKWETVKFINRIGLNSPKTFISLVEAKKAIQEKELKFPLVLKPRWGSASVGIDFIESVEELDLAYRLQMIRLKRSILAEVISEKCLNSAIIIQEKILGTEYGADILNDFQGNYVNTFVRKKLSMRAGETDKAISVIDERFNQVGKIIGENLKHIGNLDCDIFECDGKLYILELNPRFGGGYPFSHEAGSNTAAAYIEWLKGGNDISQFFNYKEGVMFSKCDRLLNIEPKNKVTN
ncbi:ATP-dependent carboxylate-amine ligase [Capnocytophaga cynodegmi]|uniref:ATP-dependent carboxylate-amine ligase n=1 Tax=Capnocytophaga cynodegmi TaxID=28189 RepID=A0A250E9P3_9FLAO|nr:ATP-grasp domain-containing protein [Capnocytophaga cynodegmi]ATA68457.1 ATP-dependent carboxylate-amine ligase [Capnocytophaga cynodegmi]